MATSGGDDRIACKRLAMIGKDLVIGAKKLFREVKVDKSVDVIEERAWFLNGQEGTTETNSSGSSLYVWWPGSVINPWEGINYTSVLYLTEKPLLFISGDETFVTGYGPNGEQLLAQKFARFTDNGWKGEYEMFENGYSVGMIDVTPSSLPEHKLVSSKEVVSYTPSSDNDYDTFPNGRPEQD